MAETNKWTIGKPDIFEDEEKRWVCSLASDDELVVCGCSGWDGKVLVYDATNGQLKFTLVCNQLEGMPAPFSHDSIEVDVGKSVIVTLSLNDNTLSLWDKNDGSLLFRNFEATENSEDSGLLSKFFTFTDMLGLTRGEDKVRCIKTVGDKVLAGTEHGIYSIENVDGEWKKTGNIGPNNKQVYDIDIDGKYALLTTIGSSWSIGADTQITVLLWNLEDEKLEEEYTREVSLYRDVAFSFPYVFFVGGIGNNPHKNGLRVLNLETGEIVRHVLKDEHKYETVRTNGKLVSICEFINMWWTGREKMLKIAVYDVKDLGNPEITEDNLWCKTLEYDGSISKEHVRCALTDNNLVINHDRTKLSIMPISNN